MKKNISFVFLFFFLFAFVSCGSQTRSEYSVLNPEECFMSYSSSSDLEKNLREIMQMEELNGLDMALVGCLNYQLGNHSVAETWLKRAFEGSKNDKDKLRAKKAKSTSAYALSLIYLKKSSQQAIKNITDIYLAPAIEHRSGSWVQVLYNLDLYRKTGGNEYLLFAIQAMESKHQQEGATSATLRFLQHMKLVNTMAENCGVSLSPASPSPSPAGGGNTATQNRSVCSEENLADEKLYLFSAAYGFLLIFLKEKPFNNRDESETSLFH